MSLKKYFDNNIITNLFQLITNNTGWQIRDQDQDTICHKIWTRMKFLKINSVQEYYQLLASNSDIGYREWQELAISFTTSESYLFRDQGQFSLLEKYLLPQLIEKQKYSKTLRIWSAGCSTGEEPYSLAITIKKLIPDIDDWNIFILGTDINPEAIQKAKKGSYSSWSFRLVNSDLQNQYFYQVKNEWQIDETIRKMVTFQEGNLMKDIFPSHSSGIYHMDLIVCRNVFIYIEFQAIATILKKFTETLKIGGYLLTGHAELQGQDLGTMQSRIFPESVVYQRCHLENNNISLVSLPTSAIEKTELRPSIDNNIVATESQASYLKNSYHTANKKSQVKNANLVPNLTSDSEPSKVILDEAKSLIRNKNYTEALKKAQQALDLQPKNFEAYYLSAQLYANLGEYERSIYCCHQAIKLDSLAVEPYYLLANIAEEQGDLEKAKNFFKKIIYLAPTSIYAYAELGYLYNLEGNKSKAQKMLHVALNMLEKLPDSTPVEPQKEITASELTRKVKKMLG